MRRWRSGSLGRDDGLQAGRAEPVATLGEPVLITRGGRPVALVVGLAGLDEDQLQLGASDKSWQLMTARRRQPTVSRAELERMAAAPT